MIIEALKPYEWKPRPEWGNARFPPTAVPAEEVMKSVEKRWDELRVLKPKKDGRTSY